MSTKNIESCPRLKRKGTKRKVILKISKRKDAGKIISKKKKKRIGLSSDCHKKIGLLSGTKVFTNVSLCGYYELIWSK